MNQHARRRGRSPSAFAIVLLFISVTVGSAGARQEGGQSDAPRLNQPGKDVQWVRTPPALVDKMLDLAGLTPQDRLVDLGSGDGVVVIAAALGAPARVASSTTAAWSSSRSARRRRPVSVGSPASSAATSSRPTSRTPPWSRPFCCRR